MKKQVCILTDTNSGITQKQAEKLGVHLVPMPILIDGEIFFEDVTLSQKEFFDRLSAGADVSTSQPAIGKLMELWDMYLAQYEQIVYQPMSSGLSSSYEIAHKLSEEPEYRGRVFVVNNHRISVTRTRLCWRQKHWPMPGRTAHKLQNT